METLWEREEREILSRAFKPLPEGALCGAGGVSRLTADGMRTIPVRAREWRLRRAVELLLEAGERGITQAMLRDVVSDPGVDSPLLDDLSAAGATSSLERRPDKRGAQREQRVWRISDEAEEDKR